MRKEKTQQNGKLWLKKETQPYGKGIFGLTVLTVLSVLFSLAFAYMVRYLVNSAGEKDKNGLLIFSVCLLVLLLFRIFFKTLDGYYAEKLRSKMFCDIRARLYAKILRSDYGKIHEEYHSGDLLNRLTSDAQEVAVDTVGFIPTLSGMLVQCVGAILALLTLNWKFTLLYVVCGATFGGLAALFRNKLKLRHKEVMQADGEVRSYVQEGLGSILTVKAYGAEGHSEQKTNELSNVYYEKRMKRNVLRAMMNALFALLSNSGLILAVVLCSITIYRSPQADYGAMLSIILLLMQMQQPLTGFSSIIPVYYTRLASGERLAEIDNLPTEIPVDAVNQDDLYNHLRAISFEKVHFTYGRETVFNDANARINKGEIICLTGPSGAGKSTIFKLLLGVYVPTNGEVRLCGDFNDGQAKTLSSANRNLFAYVPQGNFLFSGTIYDNLTFFAPETSPEKQKTDIAEALKVACAEFVYQLPQGLQTPLMEQGAGLSEGQLQRLAVARAILSKRPILLLDEATSALDTDTEKQLLENIKQLSGKTCLIVTHRPAALQIANRVFYVESGKIKSI